MKSVWVRNVSAAVLVLATLAGLWWWRAEETRRREISAERAEARRSARQERADRLLLRLREESADLMPAPLEGLALGMTLAEVQAARTLQPKLGQADPEKVFFEETLDSGASVVFGFVRETETLAQVQVLSVINSPEAFRGHFLAMVDRYGRPTSLWDCPGGDGLPTRRFGWERSRTAISDIMLIYGDRISLTLYIAPLETMGESLRKAACRPVQNEAQLMDFPVATPEALDRAQRRQGSVAR